MAAQKLITPPAVEPVDLDEAKSQCRVDGAADNEFLLSLIAQARQTIEDMAHRAFIAQTWRLSLDRWPVCDYISLPRPPLQAVTSVVYTDSAGVATTLGATVANVWTSDTLEVDSDSEPGRIYLKYGWSWPTVTLKLANPIQITYVAGYGDEPGDVAAVWKRAILLLVGHWYENREATISGTIVKEIPLGVQSLIWLNRG